MSLITPTRIVVLPSLCYAVLEIAGAAMRYSYGPFGLGTTLVHYANGLLVLIALVLHLWWRFFPGTLPNVKKNSAQDWLIRTLPLGAFLILLAMVYEEDYGRIARSNPPLQLALDLLPLLPVGAVIAALRRYLPQA